jgi:hypothetical protein
MYAISGQNNVVVGQMNTAIVDWQMFVMLLITMTLQQNPTPLLKATKSMFMTACPHYNSTKHFNFWATNNITNVDSILTTSKHGPYCNTFNNHNTFDSHFHNRCSAYLLDEIFKLITTFSMFIMNKGWPLVAPSFLTIKKTIRYESDRQRDKIIINAY